MEIGVHGNSSARGTKGTPAAGNPVIHIPPLNPSATGFDISILASDDLNVWGAAVPAADSSAAVAQERDTPGEVAYPLDPSGA